MSIEEITEILEKNPIKHRHSLFQLKYFIIEKEPTHQAKLLKCLNELDARRETIKSYIMGMDEMKDDLSLIDIEIERLLSKNVKNKQKTEILVKKLRRKKEQLQNNVKSCEKKLQETQEEAEFFVNTFKELESKEPLKDFDDFDENCQLWNEKYLRQLQMQIILGLPWDRELMNCIVALPDKIPVKAEVLKIISQVKKNINDRKNIES